MSRPETPSALTYGALLRHGCAILIGLVLLFAIIALSFGRLDAERTLTNLMLPGGLLVILLGYACYVSLRFGSSRWLSCLIVLSFGTYCVVGGGFASSWLMYVLERDFHHLRPLEGEPYDVLILLGGGVSRLADGRIQPNESGDRIVLAARLYHLKKTQRILVSTSAEPEADTLGDTAPIAVSLLLRELGVRVDDIQEVPGENTLAELQQAKSALANSADQRIGLVTSAWHMRRALRLAGQCGLTVSPVPADFRSLGKRTKPYEWIPTGRGFEGFALAAKELVAGMIGR